MGEQEEKETPQTENTGQQEVAEEPKETDKMLEKKDDETKQSSEKLVEGKKKSSSKPSTPTAEKKDKEKSEAGESKTNGGGEEIIDIPEGGAKAETAESADERKLSAEEREVKPKKIPIGGLKLPGFFMKNKPKSDGDGAEGELLEKENKDAEEGERKPAKKEDKPAKNFGERLRNFFVRKPAEKQAKQQASAAEIDNKSGKFSLFPIARNNLYNKLFLTFQKLQQKQLKLRVMNNKT